MPLSPILVAILLGLVLRNAVGLPTIFAPGLEIALKRVLRVGVALLGIRLSLANVGALGIVALPIIVASIATALFLVTRLGRLMGLPPRLATLIAVGTAICGNSAIVAMAPVIQADDDEVSYAVGCVTLFGLVALAVYPFLGHALFDGEPTLVGLFLGTAIHDTAQVAGAALVYVAQFGAPEALDAATITKLRHELATAEKAKAGAEVNVGKLRSALGRAEAAMEAGVASIQQLEAQVACADTLRGDLNKATARHKALEVQVSEADEALAAYRERGATIVEEIASRPWGMREFTIEDNNGHRFRIGHSEGPVVTSDEVGGSGKIAREGAS
ncbi:MAG: putative sulfate exporter family transporter, partial [bacterium]